MSGANETSINVFMCHVVVTRVVLIGGSIEGRAVDREALSWRLMSPYWTVQLPGACALRPSTCPACSRGLLVLSYRGLQAAQHVGIRRRRRRRRARLNDGHSSVRVAPDCSTIRPLDPAARTGVPSTAVPSSLSSPFLPSFPPFSFLSTRL